MESFNSNGPLGNFARNLALTALALGLGGKAVSERLSDGEILALGRQTNARVMTIHADACGCSCDDEEYEEETKPITYPNGDEEPDVSGDDDPFDDDDDDDSDSDDDSLDDDDDDSDSDDDVTDDDTGDDDTVDDDSGDDDDNEERVLSIHTTGPGGATVYVECEGPANPGAETFGESGDPVCDEDAEGGNVFEIAKARVLKLRVLTGKKLKVWIESAGVLVGVSKPRGEAWDETHDSKCIGDDFPNWPGESFQSGKNIGAGCANVEY